MNSVFKDHMHVTCLHILHMIVNSHHVKVISDQALSWTKCIWEKVMV